MMVYTLLLGAGGCKLYREFRCATVKFRGYIVALTHTGCMIEEGVVVAFALDETSRVAWERLDACHYESLLDLVRVQASDSTRLS